MTPHDGQLEVLRNARRFNAVACGRRWGKTRMGIWIALTGGTPNHQKALAQGYDVGWFAPSYKLLDEAWRECKSALEFIGIERLDSQRMRMELRTGAALDFWTLEDQDAGRGRRYGVTILDEAAMSRYLEPAWNASIRPTLTDFQGSGWFLSTPKGGNYFKQLFDRGQDQSRWPEWASFRSPTASNPYIKPEEIEEARKSLPERIFAQEYLATFLDEGGGVFRRVLDAVDDTLPTLHTQASPVPGASYVIGVDWGRHADFTVYVVLDARTGAVVSVDRFTDIGFRIQRDRLNALAQRFPGAPIIVERNSFGEVQAEELQRDPIIGDRVRTFMTTAASKAQIIEDLALAFERGDIRIPRLPWFITELVSFDAERMPSGMLKYGAPPGQHDDGVMALAIAWHGRSFGGSAWASPIKYPSLGAVA
jgi:hypothetical protein